MKNCKNTQPTQLRVNANSRKQRKPDVQKISLQCQFIFLILIYVAEYMYSIYKMGKTKRMYHEISIQQMHQQRWKI